VFIGTYQKLIPNINNFLVFFLLPAAAETKTPKMRGKTNKADILLGVCYRPPNQEDEVDEVYYKRFAEVSQLLAFFPVGHFNLQDICWKYNTAERKQSRKFLECVEDNLLMQLVSEPTRGDASLMTELSFRGEVKTGASKTTTMDFQRADFGLFRTLVDGVPWARVLKGKGVQAGWTFFKEEVLKAQEQAVPICRKMNQQGRRPAWLNREILQRVRKKRRVYHL